MNKFVTRVKKLRITNDIISDQRTLIMGLATLSILFFHYVEDCMKYKVNQNFLFTFWNQWFASAGVDIFVFLSGLGLYYSMKKNNNIKKFYCKRFARILIPYFIVAIPALIYRDIIVEGLTIGYAIKEVFFVTFFTQGKNWFWYIGFSIVVYIIFPYIFRIIESSNDDITEEMRLLNLSSAITVLAVVLSSSNAKIFNYTNIALLRLPIFFAGAFYGKSSYEKRSSSWKWIAVFFISVFMRFMDIKNPMNSIIVRRYTLALVSISICFFIALFFSYFKLKPIRVIIEFFGKYSLWIYLLHVAIRGILNLNGYYTYKLKYEVIVIIGSIVLSLLLQGMINIIIKKIIHREGYNARKSKGRTK